MRGRHFLLICIALTVLLLAACSTSGPFDEANAPAGDTQPHVDDPDAEINVTPQPEEKFAYFTVKVTRLGVQAPKIGWHASGEIYLKVAVNSDMPLNVVGTGFGTAGFDLASPVCIETGGWPIEYTANGHFDIDKCEITLNIEETWPKTEAQANCLGMSSSTSGGVYKLNFHGINFEDDNPRVDTTTDLDMLVWANTFELIPREGLKGTGCLFEEN